MKFGDLVKDLRIAQKKTLRQFCMENSHDPSNWSKIERNINPPPKDRETLSRWAGDLGLRKESDEWKDFMMKADISRGEIPQEVLSDEKLLTRLPVFFRTVSGAPLTDEKLDRLMAHIKEVYSPDEHKNRSEKRR